MMTDSCIHESWTTRPEDIVCSAVDKLVKRQTRNFSPVVLAHWQISIQCQRPRHRPLGYSVQNATGITQCGVEAHQNRMTDSCARDSWTNILEDSGFVNYEKLMKRQSRNFNPEIPAH